MRSLKWIDEYLVFNSQMDEEHRSLFDAMESLRHGLLAGEALERVALQAGFLSNRTAAHFRHEESMMRASRYGASAWHEQQHQAARMLLGSLQDAINGRGVETAYSALNALADWFVNHLSVADRMLSAHLGSLERARAAAC